METSHESSLGHEERSFDREQGEPVPGCNDWYAFYSEAAGREYYYNEKRRIVTWIMPDDLHPYDGDETQPTEPKKAQDSPRHVSFHRSVSADQIAPPESCVSRDLLPGEETTPESHDRVSKNQVLQLFRFLVPALVLIALFLAVLHSASLTRTSSELLLEKNGTRDEALLEKEISVRKSVRLKTWLKPKLAQEDHSKEMSGSKMVKIEPSVRQKTKLKTEEDNNVRVSTRVNSQVSQEDHIKKMAGRPSVKQTSEGTKSKKEEQTKRRNEKVTASVQQSGTASQATIAKDPEKITQPRQVAANPMIAVELEKESKPRKAAAKPTNDSSEVISGTAKKKQEEIRKVRVAAGEEKTTRGTAEAVINIVETISSTKEKKIQLETPHVNRMCLVPFAHLLSKDCRQQVKEHPAFNAQELIDILME